MAILLIHLSDIHIKDERDVIFGRADQIVAAAFADLSAGVTACHILVTGDIVQSGLKEEYAAADGFFGKLRDEIKARIEQNPKFIFCPGNHDCDLANNQSVRNALLPTVTSGKAVEVAIAVELAKPLTAYFEFTKRWSDQDELLPWFSTVRYNDEAAVRYTGINSSVTSTNPENKGHLFVPVEQFPKSGDSDEVLSIVLMHQPANWHDPDCARDLNDCLESSADMVFLGHEHRERAVTVAGMYDKSKLAMFHGDVLQSRTDPESSGFRSLLIKNATEIKCSRHILHDGIYRKDDAKSDVEWQLCSNAEARKASFTFSPTFQEWLEDTGATFSHRRKQKLSLSDIFVWPNLRQAIRSRDSKSVLLDSNLLKAGDFVGSLQGRTLTFVVGDEQAGKTTLSKRWLGQLRSSGVIPVYISGPSISSVRGPAIAERIDSAVRRQYGDNLLDRFRQLSPDRRAVVIDDFDYIGSNADAKSELLRLLAQNFHHVLIFTHNTPGTEIFLEQLLDSGDLPPACTYELLPLSYELRVALIEKWLRVGNEYSTEIEDIEATATQFARLVNDTIGRNLVPAVPIFVLIILQRAESESDIESVIKNGSHGFLYEAMIIQAVSHKVNIFSVNTAITYLTGFAGYLYQDGIDGLKEHDARHFHDDHCNAYDIRASFDKLAIQFVDAGIWAIRRERYVFAYPYLYFYFVARHLAGLANPEQRLANLDILIDTIHTESAANILLFLAHLGRDENIIIKLLERANSIFSDQAEFDAFEALPLFERFGENRIREILYEGTRGDKIAHYEETEVSLSPEDVADSRGNGDLGQVQEVARRLNTAFRTLQVLGQLLRNHVGSIERDRKREIADACVGLGLRTLGFSLRLFEDVSQELVEARVDFIRQSEASKAASLTKREDMILEAQNYMSSVITNVSVGTIARIASAIGCEDLAPTLEHVLGDAHNDTRGILAISVQLEHFRTFPEPELMAFADRKISARDQFAMAILRRFIVRRFYLFPDPNELLKRVCKLFNIERKPFQVRGISHRKNLPSK